MPKIVDHEQRRQSIAHAALLVIAERGLEGSKLVDIGKLAGVTTGAITHYFDDKDAVLNAALEAAYQLVFDKIEAARAKRNADLKLILEQVLPLDVQSRNAMSVWLAFWSRSLAESKVASQQERFHLRWHAIVETAVKEHCKTRSSALPKNLEDCCESITAFVNGLIIRGLLDPEQWPAKRQRRMLQEFLTSQKLD